MPLLELITPILSMEMLKITPQGSALKLKMEG